MRQEIGSEFTTEGLQKLKKGQLLRFDFEGSMIEFIVTSKNIKQHKLWVKDVTTYHPDQVKITKDGKDKAFSEGEL